MTAAIVVNGSPRGDRGNTAALLGPFIEGMNEGGCQVDLLHASRLRIKPCVCGKMRCWYGTPGRCGIQDDMQELYPRLEAVELLVLATPVYIPLPGDMQNFINRLCPLIRPLVEMREGRTRARTRDGVRLRRIALVATGSWWEKENLGTVVRIVEELAADAGVEYAGAVLRPHADVMKVDGRLTEDGRAVLAAAKRAGRELVGDGGMTEATLEAVSRPLISADELLRRDNSLL